MKRPAPANPNPKSEQAEESCAVAERHVQIHAEEWRALVQLVTDEDSSRRRLIQHLVSEQSELRCLTLRMRTAQRLRVVQVNTVNESAGAEVVLHPAELKTATHAHPVPGDVRLPEPAFRCEEQLPAELVADTGKTGVVRANFLPPYIVARAELVHNVDVLLVHRPVPNNEVLVGQVRIEAADPQAERAGQAADCRQGIVGLCLCCKTDGQRNCHRRYEFEFGFHGVF